MPTGKTYIQNLTDGLYYGTWYVTDPDGTIRLMQDDVGISMVPPPVVPVAGIPLIDIPTYMMALRIGTLPCTEQEWTLAAMGVSYAVEKYTGYAYRADALEMPDGLSTVVAMMIKMRLAVNTGERDLTKKSESITNYSYTLNGTQTDMPTVLDMYRGELDMYKNGSAWMYVPSTSTALEDL